MAGSIKTNSVQLGDSATATQNFVWQTNVDGTAKLARGNAGATTQDILTVDAAGKVAFPQNTVEPKIVAWAKMTSNGAASPTINGQYNIASVVRTALGLYSVTFTTALPDANYAVSFLIGQAGVGVLVAAQSNLGFNVNLFATSTGANVDQNSPFLSNLLVTR